MGRHLFEDASKRGGGRAIYRKEHRPLADRPGLKPSSNLITGKANASLSLRVVICNVEQSSLSHWAVVKNKGPTVSNTKPYLARREIVAGSVDWASLHALIIMGELVTEQGPFTCIIPFDPPQEPSTYLPIPFNCPASGKSCLHSSLCFLTSIYTSDCWNLVWTHCSVGAALAKVIYGLFGAKSSRYFSYLPSL